MRSFPCRSSPRISRFPFFRFEVSLLCDRRSVMVRRRFDVTEQQWFRIQSLLPKQTTGAQPLCHRTVLNGMLWVLRTGSPWRDMPQVYGNWKSVHTRFLRWCRSGVFKRILAEIADHELDAEFAMVDGSLVRVHQDTAGGKKTEPSSLVAPEEEQQRRFTLSWTV